MVYLRQRVFGQTPKTRTCEISENLNFSDKFLFQLEWWENKSIFEVWTSEYSKTHGDRWTFNCISVTASGTEERLLFSLSGNLTKGRLFYFSRCNTVLKLSPNVKTELPLVPNVCADCLC